MNLQRIFKGRRSKNIGSDLAGMNMLLNLPKKNMLSEDKLEKLDYLIKYYENIIKTKGILSLLDLETDVYDKMQMYISLILDYHIKDNENRLMSSFYNEKDDTLIFKKIDILKIRMYLKKIKSLKSETELRIIALQEINNRTFNRSKKGTIRDEINSLEILWGILNSNEVSITKEIETYLQNIEYDMSSVYVSELREAKARFYGILYHTACLIDINIVKDIYQNGDVPDMPILEENMENIVVALRYEYDKHNVPENLVGEIREKQNIYEDLLLEVGSYYLPDLFVENVWVTSENVINRCVRIEQELSKYIEIDSNSKSENETLYLLNREKELCSMARVIIPETLNKILSSKLDSGAKVVALEIALEEYVYSNPEVLVKMREEIESDKNFDLKRIEELEFIYKIYDSFGRDLVKSEDLNKLYKLKFDFITAHDDMTFNLNEINCAEYECYQNIVLEKINAVIMGNNETVKRLFFESSMKEVIQLIKNILTQGKDEFSPWDILNSKELLNFLLAFDDESKFKEYFKKEINEQFVLISFIEKTIQLSASVSIGTLFKLTDQEDVSIKYRDLHRLYNLWLKASEDYEFPVEIIELNEVDLKDKSIIKLKNDFKNKNIIFTRSVKNLILLLPEEHLSMVLRPEYLECEKGYPYYIIRDTNFISLTSDDVMKKRVIYHLTLSDNVKEFHLQAFDIREMISLTIPIDSLLFQSYEGISYFIRKFYIIEETKCFEEGQDYGVYSHEGYFRKTGEYDLTPSCDYIIIKTGENDYNISSDLFKLTINPIEISPEKLIEEHLFELADKFIAVIKSETNYSNDFFDNYKEYSKDKKKELSIISHH